MNIVILAAGQGKRMRSALPKVLHCLAGKPMLAHVLETARAVARARGVVARIVVVIGHGADQVRSKFDTEPDIRFVLQEPQLGTGHAVQQAASLLDDAEPTLILYGDVPLMRDGNATAPCRHRGGRQTRRDRPADGKSFRPARLRAHRARLARQRAAHRRGARRQRRGARDQRGQHRHPDRADRAAEALARRRCRTRTRSASTT